MSATARPLPALSALPVLTHSRAFTELPHYEPFRMAIGAVEYVGYAVPRSTRYRQFYNTRSEIERERNVILWPLKGGQAKTERAEDLQADPKAVFVRFLYQNEHVALHGSAEIPPDGEPADHIARGVAMTPPKTILDIANGLPFYATHTRGKLYQCVLHGFGSSRRLSVANADTGYTGAIAARVAYANNWRFERYLLPQEVHHHLKKHIPEEK